MDNTTNVIYKPLKPQTVSVIIQNKTKENMQIYVDRILYNLKTLQLQPFQTWTQAPAISRGVIIL